MNKMIQVLLMAYLVLGPVHARPRVKFESTATHVSPSQVTQIPVAAPADGEVCFSPDEPCALKLVKFIESAKTSLDIAIFDITEDQIVHAILVQSKKIPVRVVVDARQAKGKYSSVPLLRKVGVNLKIGRQRGIMHDKFVIVDGKRLETGSFNYTNHASEANQENQIYLSAPAVLARYRDRFEKIWREAKSGAY